MSDVALKEPFVGLRHAPRQAGHDAGKSSGFFFKLIFGISYFLLILASTRLVRDDIVLLDNVNILRIALIGAAGALWIGRSTVDRSMPLSAMIVGALLSFYMLTDAIVAFVDVLSLLIFSAALARSRSSGKYLVYLAYGSLAFVCAIAIFAALGVLPSTVYEWEGRVKNGYGFGNPNTFFFYLFSSAFTFFVFRERRGFFLSGLIIAVMYASVGSRTFGIAYLFIFMAFLLANRINGRLLQTTLWAGILLVALAGVLTVYFPYEISQWSSGILQVNSDELLSSRLSLMERAYSDISDAEFWLGGMENASDSMYYYFASSFGILILLALLGVTLYRLGNLSKRYGSIPLVFVLSFLMVGIVEVPFDGSALMSLVFIYVIFYDSSVFERWKQTGAVRKARTVARY